MSVTSHDPNATNTDFFDWLSRYPVLARWLAACLEREPELNEEEAHSRFLAECLNQGVSSEDNPFTGQDRGFSALRDFRLRLQTGTSPEIAPLHIGVTHPEDPGGVVEQTLRSPEIAVPMESATIDE